MAKHHFRIYSKLTEFSIVPVSRIGNL